MFKILLKTISISDDTLNRNTKVVKLDSAAIDYILYQDIDGLVTVK